MSLKSALTSFRTANVLRRFAMEHTSPEARKEYLSEHPNADPSNHTVDKGEDKKHKPESLELYGQSRKVEKSLKTINSLVKKMKNMDDNKKAEAFKKVVGEGNKVLDLAAKVHKKLEGKDSKASKSEYQALSKSIKELDSYLEKNRDSSVPAFTAQQIEELAGDLHGDIHRVSALSIAGHL